MRKLFSEGSLRENKTWIKEVKDYLLPFDVRPAEFKLSGLLQNDCKRWGDVLKQAGNLRNDSNYEGLLISHEYNHAKVTQSFHRLAITLKDACEEVHPKMVGVFKDFVDNAIRRDHWYAFLNWRSAGEGLYYLEASLKHRAASEGAVYKILGWLNGMCRQPDSDTALAEEVHNNIVMSAFGMKSALMRDFETKIDDFEGLLKE